MIRYYVWYTDGQWRQSGASDGYPTYEQAWDEAEHHARNKVEYVILEAKNMFI